MEETIVYDCMINAPLDLGIPNLRSETSLSRVLLRPGRKQSDLCKFDYEMPFQNYQGREISLLSNLPMSQVENGQWWAFQIKGVMTFYWKIGNHSINYWMHGKQQVTLLRYWLLHTVLPLYFTLEENYFILHAGSVEIRNGSILFIGPSHGGKSTLTDYFLRKGHNLISDDKAAVWKKGGVIHVAPSYPFHRPYRREEDLGYPVSQFSSSSKPLFAIYSLKQVAAKADIRISELHGIEKFRSLRINSEFDFPFFERKRFEFLSQMADQVAVYCIELPWDLHRLPEVYMQLLSHVKEG